MDPSMAAVLGGVVVGVGPLLTGIAALRKNASQASVDKLHDCLDGLKTDFIAHTEQDRENFERINERFDQQAEVAEQVRAELESKER